MTVSNDPERSTILVVDDEAMIRTILQRALSPRYRVIAVENPLAALDVLGREPIDFVMSDVNMPGGSGIDLVSQMHERWPDLQVAFLAAVIDEATQARIEDLGATLFIKPFDVPELLSMLELLVPAPRSRHQTVDNQELGRKAPI